MSTAGGERAIAGTDDESTVTRQSSREKVRERKKGLVHV